MRTRVPILIGLALCLGVTGCERNRAPRDDVAITGDVQNQITVARLPGAITVMTDGGIVTLSGNVPDVQVKARAGETAIKVAGVKRVNNEIRVTMAGDAPIPPAERPYPPMGAAPRQPNPPAEQMQPNAPAPRDMPAP